MRIFASMLMLAAVPSVQAQFLQRLLNPDVQVELTHPPGLGIKVTRVAFAPTEGTLAEDLVSACISELMASSPIDIVDRTTTQKLLQEQKFSNSGLVDGDMAVEMGRVLGSPVLLLFKVHTAKVRQERSHKQEETKGKDGKVSLKHTYLSRIQMDFAASVQAVDTATGKIYSARRIVLDPSRERTGGEAYPEYPSEFEVREEAIRKATTEVVRMLLPWKERRKLIFFDDRDYGMKEAYKALDAKDYPEAMKRSQDALNRAKDDPKAGVKYLSRTNYNLGMCHFITGDYDAALPLLQAARRMDTDNGIFRESAQECEKAVALKAEMTRAEIRGAGLGRPGAANAPSPAPSQTAGAKPSVEERLERLNSLFKKGLIDEKEFQARKAEILKEI